MLSITSFTTSLSRITNGLQAPALALGLALGSAACSSNNPTTDGGDGGTTVTDGGGGTGGDGGIGGDGGTGGDGGGMGSLITGSQYVPSPFLPMNGSVLPPTYALILWQPGATPAGRTFQNYEFCLTPGPASEIDEASECPFSETLPDTSAFFSLQAPGASFRWKVRALYDAGHYSDWSAVQLFSFDTSLVAWLTMNNNANDTSGAGNNGTVNGGAGYVTGVESQALSLDGVDDYVGMGSGLALTGPLSVSVWIYANGVPTGASRGILNQGALNCALTYGADGNVNFFINNSGNSLSAPVTPGEWHNVVGVFDGTTSLNGLRLYVDGAFAGETTSTSATTGATGALELGRYLTGYFNGRIDNVTIYNAVLSDGAILNEYCSAQVAGGAAVHPACLP